MRVSVSVCGCVCVCARACVHSSRWECAFSWAKCLSVQEREREETDRARESWRIFVITWDWMCQVISTSVKESWGGETGNLMSVAASQLISERGEGFGRGHGQRHGRIEEGWGMER